VSFAAITLCVILSECLLFLISLSAQSGNVWIHARIIKIQEFQDLLLITNKRGEDTLDNQRNDGILKAQKAIGLIRWRRQESLLKRM